MALSSATAMTASTIPPNVLVDRDERIKRFGIECIGPAGDGILFKAGHWRPGGEYIQKLIIRNVSTEVKKLKYKLPSTRYFSLAYPEPIILSPGLSREVDVVFRPVEYEPYDDTLYIKLLDGIHDHGFHIPVRATIDKLSLTAPDGLDLGYCPTHQTTEIVFPLINDGEIDAPFEWEVPPPFVFSPMSGVIPMGGRQAITVSLLPTDASVFVSKALCHVGRGVHAIIPQPLLTVKLSAIGKYTYLTLSESVVDFEEVVSGTVPDAKECVLSNPSVVPTQFKLVRLDADRDEVFEIEPKEGVLPPRSETIVTIRYAALAAGSFSLDRYAYQTPSQVSAVFTCQGMAMPPAVSLYRQVSPSLPPPPPQSSTSAAASSSSSSQALSYSTLHFGEDEGAPAYSLNFRDVEVGRTETRVFFLRNDSPREVHYSIAADAHGIFEMHPLCGSLPPLCKSFAVRLRFRPRAPLNYYRRFFVQVADAPVLFYDCLGTGFVRARGEVKEQRPAPLRAAHVQAHANRVVYGLGRLAPEDLDVLQESLPRDFFAQVGRQGTRAVSCPTAVLRPVTRSGEALRSQVAPAMQFFLSRRDGTSQEVLLDRADTGLDFGYTLHGHRSEAQEVTVTNCTRAKLTVAWHIPSVEEEEEEGKEEGEGEDAMARGILTVDAAVRRRQAIEAFDVSPLQADVPPGGKQTFTVVFTPKQSNRNYCCQLEAVAYCKNQRTFRLVNDATLLPPWTLPLSVRGHTFSEGQLLAKTLFQGGAVRQRKLVFPPAYPGDAVFQTVLLRNTSNLPATFTLTLTGLDGLDLDTQTDDAVWESGAVPASSLSPRPGTGKTKTGPGAGTGTIIMQRGEGSLVGPPSVGAPLSRFVSLAESGQYLRGEEEGMGTGGPPVPVFSVRPVCGEIAPESFVLVTLRYAPPAVLSPSTGRGGGGRHRAVVQCAVNGLQASFSSSLQVEGQAAVPQLCLVDLLQQACPYKPPAEVWGLPRSVPAPPLPAAACTGEVLLSPTAVGLSSHRTLSLKNLSRLPCRFRLLSHLCYPSHPDDPVEGDVVRVTPREGLLRGNACQTLSVVFSPKVAERAVRVEVRVEVTPLVGQTPRVLDCVQPGGAGVPPVVQILAFSLAGEGTTGALAFSPAVTDLPVQLVHTEQQTRLWLENASEAPLYYRLRVTGQAVLDVAAGQTRTVTFGPLPLPSSSPSAKERGEGEGCFGLCCDRPQGLLEARAKRILAVHFLPPCSGAFSFTLSAHLLTQDQIEDSGNLDTIVPEPGPSRPRVPDPDPDLESNLDLEGQIARRFAASGLVLTARLEARAAFPQVVVDDVRYLSPPAVATEAAAIQDAASLWRRWSLARLNYDLALPLTRSELSAYQASSLDVSRLQHYAVHFSPAVVHSPSQTLALLLTNSGYLETRFSLSLPNETSLELENWCEEKQASEAHNRLVSLLEELKLFSISPREGVLRPGESRLVCLTYHPVSLKYAGVHDLPVTVRIAQGKVFVWDVHARTLALPAPTAGLGATSSSPASRQGRGTTVRIVDPRMSTLSRQNNNNNNHNSTHTSSAVSSAASPSSSSGPPACDCLLVLPQAEASGGDVHLDPVPVGLSPRSTRNRSGRAGSSEAMREMDPGPVQTLRVVNLSAQAVAYEAVLGRELSPLEDEVLQANYLLPVAKVLNPRGVVPAQASVYLQVVFYPLQARDYALPLCLAYRPALASSSFSLATPSAGERSVSASVMTVDRYTLRYVGYDPRGPVPILPASLYRGGQPPETPRLQRFALQLLQQQSPQQLPPALAPRPVYLVEDRVSFGLVPQRSTVHRLVSLHNASSTASFDYYVDEPASLLCSEGLLSVHPVYGTLAPGETVLVNLRLDACCQARGLADQLVFVLRELLRTQQRSRGGAKQALLDKLKARRTVHTPHASVVARPTRVHTMHLVEEGGGEGLLRGGYPTTVTQPGQLVTVDVADQVAHTLARVSGQTASLSPSGMERGHRGSVNVLTMEGGGGTAVLGSTQDLGDDTGLLSSPGSPAGETLGSRSVGSTLSRKLDVLPSSGAAAKSRVRLDSQGSRSLALSPSRTGGGGGTPSVAASGSRTPGSRLGTGSVFSAGGGGAAAPRYGQSFSLTVSLTGQVHSVETLRAVVWREPAPQPTGLNLQNTRLLDCFLLPPRPVFLPALDKNFFDEDFQAERRAFQNKSRVNIAFVEDRDDELRRAAYDVFDKLVVGLLQQAGLADAVYTALTGNNPSEVALCSVPPLAPFDLPSTASPHVGVFYAEVQRSLPLHRRLVSAVQETGYVVASPGEETASLTLHDLTAALQDLGCVSPAFAHALQTAEQQASANLRGSFSSATPGSFSSLYSTSAVELRGFVWDMLDSTGRQELRQQLDRRGGAGAGDGKAEGEGEGEREEAALSASAASPPPSPLAPTESLAVQTAFASSESETPAAQLTAEQRQALVQQACGQESFPEVAAHALAAMMFDMLQTFLHPLSEDM